MTSAHRATRRLLIALVSVGLMLTALSVPASGSAEQPPAPQELELEEEQLVRILVPGNDVIYDLQDAGYDLAGNVERVPNGIEVDALVTEDQLDELDTFGVFLADEAPEPTDAAPAPSLLQVMDTDTVVVGRVDWFTTKGQGFLSVEAKSSENQAADLTLSWDGGSATIPVYIDSGEYMYHRVQVAVDDPRPDTVTVTSSLGGEDTAEVTDWLYPTDVDVNRPGYQSGFVDGYMNPTELFERIEELAAEHPDVAEIVELPYDTNGYQRLAQAIFEPPPPPLPNLVVVDAPSSAAGSYEGNGASFGPAPDATGIAGNIVLVNDGSANPTEGCDPLVGFPTGAVALVDRGSCNYSSKVTNAQAAGATAVIVANSTGGTPPNMGGSCASCTIPAVHVSEDDGAAIKAGLPATGTVRSNDAPIPPPQPPSRVVIDSLAWGHEGGNDISVAMVDPGEADSPLGVEVDGDAIVVSLGTDGDGEPVSTAAEVVAAINDDEDAAELVVAYTYRSNAGDGVVVPAAPTLLSDFLSAPDEIERGPFTVRALRIGVNRDGSKPGVLIVAQDHAREWVTPLVALEAAERLLANYGHDDATRRILRNVDIFVIPSNNPDGSHYSFFDREAQRRNMTNYCERTGSADPLARGNWGVDLNRNYRVGSAHDGYTGASFSCTSDTYQGPEKLSEPEAKNVVWMAENFENIKFFMTIHSSGGQLFWQPGAYIAEGRITTPRPPLRDEQYYWTMAEEILSNVKGLRDSVVQPRNVGGSSDVLYSSAGNVREDLYHNYGIYAFGWEVGGQQWDPETRNWVSGGGFMPVWPEADQQYQEYASGIISMFDIAADWGQDRRPARTHLVQEVQGDGSVHVSFNLSEPANVYYTTDGSQPTVDSALYEASNIREPGQVIPVTETTTFRWFSVDVKDNVEAERSVTVRAPRRPTGN